MIHLHLHSDSSFLDGVGRAEEYAALAKARGVEAIALTDHGNLFGLPDLKRACEAQGIKPLYGCEFYLNNKRDEAKDLKLSTNAKVAQASNYDPELRNHHQLLIAMNDEGWRNLLRLNHDAVRHGYYRFPRTTVDKIIEHNEGLIATTTCLTSIFSRFILEGRTKQFLAMLDKYQAAFGDRLYYELQPHPIDDQRTVNEALVKACEKRGIEPVVTCDVHFATPQDHDTQDLMLAVARNTTLDDPKRFKIDSKTHWFMDDDEVVKQWKKNKHPGGEKLVRRAIANTHKLAARCDADIYSEGEMLPPPYIDDEGKRYEGDAAFEKLKGYVRRGYAERIKPNVDDPKPYAARIKREMGIIKRCGMAQFYLVTLDVVRECRKRGIFVWVRGSGCASLVSAAVGISQQDPLRHKLLFERFIDPSRPNAPDFDLDIDSKRREEIIEWVTKKYGNDGENIARICAIHTFGIKSAINRVFKSHGVNSQVAWRVSQAADNIDPKVVNALASATPDDRQTLFDEAFDALIEHVKGDDARYLTSHRDIVDDAFNIVGRRSGVGQHAAGYVITPTPVVDYLPVHRLTDSKTKQPIIVTSWSEGQAASDIGPTGLMKLDFLGLDTISVVSETIALASKRHNRNVIDEVDSWTMDFSDPDVAAEFATGRGFGLHQLSALDQMLAKFAARLEPKDIDDIVAMIALYRPGSLEFLDEYLERHKGNSTADPVHSDYDAILKDTHGIIVYQEQIMLILNRIGGIELREAYQVIKAISKKKVATIQKSRAQFIKGAGKQGIEQHEAEHVFDLIEKFAGYGFNRAHSASYGELSWVTAYLRNKYPLEFYASLLNATENKSTGKGKDERKLDRVMRQAAATGIELLPPSVGLSSSSWRPTKSGKLIAPLVVIKGVGAKVGDATRQAHKDHGFKTVYQFLAWAEDNKGVVNAGALKSLAKAGAFRTWKMPATASLDLVEAWSARRPGKRLGTKTEQIEALLAEGAEHIFTSHPSKETAMIYEQQALGFNFWHDAWALNGRAMKARSLEKRGRIAPANNKRLRGKRRAFLIASVRTQKDRKGGLMAFATLETKDGESVRCVCFSSVYKKCRATLKTGNVVLIAGNYERSGELLVDGRPKNPVVTIDSIPADHDT